MCGGATAAVWRGEAGQSRREGRGRGGRPGAGRGREGGRRRKRVRGGDAPGGAEGEVTRGRLAGRAAASRVRLASRGPHARRHPHARPGLEGGRARWGGWASALCSQTSVRRRPTLLGTLKFSLHPEYFSRSSFIESRARWLTPVISTPRRLRQEDSCEFEGGRH